MADSLFKRFAPVLRDALPPSVRDERLLIDAQDAIKIYYVPFEYINRDARVVLVGITPGPTQMANGNKEARRALVAGQSPPEAMRAAKGVAAFSGEPMRGNLIKQLNHWGVQHWLGIADAAALFAKHSALVQTTSLLRYPVFQGDKEYRGAPDMMKHPLLKKHLLEYFAAEVAELKDAIFFGLGPAVQSVLERLAADGLADRKRIIGGLLHPSGQNGYRIEYLTGSRNGTEPHRTNIEAYDKGRAAFRSRFLA